MMKKIDLWISLDHETDGPCAGLHNMLTFGAAAFNSDGERVGRPFYARIIELPDLRSFPDTMIWWRKQSPVAYKEAFDKDLPGVLAEEPTQPRTTAYDAMLNLSAWLEEVKEEAKATRFIPTGWPAAFDYAFTNYYCYRFLNTNPMGFACHDMRSYIMGLMRRRGYYDMREEEVNNLFGKAPKNTLRPHVAVDDAISQGELFFFIRNHPKASIELIKNA